MTPPRRHKGILRYGMWTRINHWLVAISFVLLALSGLALFHPYFWSLTGLFGGPISTRIIHPFIGLFMTLLFAIMAISFFNESLNKRHDVQWLKQIKDVLSNRDDRLPPVGKSNAGQKLVYWIMVLCVPLLLVSGIMIWEPYFGDVMPVTLRRLGGMTHAYVAFLAILTLIIHIYSGIWVKGSIHAMVSGRVSRAWARHHHSLWYESEMQKKHRLESITPPQQPPTSGQEPR